MRQDKTNSWSIQIVCRSYALKVDLLLISSLKLKSGGGLSSTILSRPWLILSYVKSMFFDVVSETEHHSEADITANGKDPRYSFVPMSFCTQLFQDVRKANKLNNVLHMTLLSLEFILLQILQTKCSLHEARQCFDLKSRWKDTVKLDH